MENKIGIIGFSIIIAAILLFLGKINLLDFILFPFYVLGGCFSFVLIIILIIIIISVIIGICSKK